MTCILCGNCQHDTVAKKEDIRFECYGYDKKIVKCTYCGLVRLTPPWSDEDLNLFYLNYPRHPKDFAGQKRNGKMTSYLTRYCKKNQVILEVGHGTGSNVKHLWDLGYCVHGIDKDRTCCDGDRLIHSDYRYHIDLVDFVYAIQVFEHIPDPLYFVKKIRGFLRPNGRFLLELPNLDDPLLKLYKVKGFKKFYFYPYHLFFYTADTLTLLMKKTDCRFKVKLYQRYGIMNHLRWIFLGKPSNANPHIPIIDDIYKFVLTHIFKLSDTLLVIGEK